jgi:hypothetical protein
LPTTVTWDGTTADWYSSNWDYPTGTNPGPPPAAGDDVDLSGGGTVTLDASEPGYVPLDVASVDIDDTTLEVDQDETIPDLTLAGIDGGGIITTGSGVGPVTITVSGSFAMGAKYLNDVVSDGHINGNITINLTGSGNIGGTLGNDIIGGNDGGTAVLHVATIGTLTFDDSAALGADANGELANDGLVEKLAATSGTSGVSSIGAQFTNSSTGTIDVDAGSLALSGSDNSIGGMVEGAGTLDLSGTSTLEPDLTLANDGVTLESRRSDSRHLRDRWRHRDRHAGHDDMDHRRGARPCAGHAHRHEFDVQEHAGPVCRDRRHAFDRWEPVRWRKFRSRSVRSVGHGVHPEWRRRDARHQRRTGRARVRRQRQRPGHLPEPQQRHADDHRQLDHQQLRQLGRAWV